MNFGVLLYLAFWFVWHFSFLGRGKCGSRELTKFFGFFLLQIFPLIFCNILVLLLFVWYFTFPGKGKCEWQETIAKRAKTALCFYLIWPYFHFLCLSIFSRLIWYVFTIFTRSQCETASDTTANGSKTTLCISTS